jgi:predicted nucleotidyltransferase
VNREQVIKLEIQEQLQKIGGDLEGYKVVLFGSRASGRARSRSDFDVGIIGDRPIPLATFYRIDDILAAIDTLYTIDWVDLNRVTPAFRREALRTTETLYEG